MTTVMALSTFASSESSVRLTIASCSIFIAPLRVERRGWREGLRTKRRTRISPSRSPPCNSHLRRNRPHVLNFLVIRPSSSFADAVAIIAFLGMRGGKNKEMQMQKQVSSIWGFAREKSAGKREPLSDSVSSVAFSAAPLSALQVSKSQSFPMARSGMNRKGRGGERRRRRRRKRKREKERERERESTEARFDDSLTISFDRDLLPLVLCDVRDAHAGPCMCLDRV